MSADPKAFIARDRDAAAVALGAPPLLARSNRRSRWVAWAAMTALLIAVTATGLALLGRHVATAAVSLELGSDAPTVSPPVARTATDEVPAVTVVVPIAAPVATPVKGPLGPQSTVKVAQQVTSPGTRLETGPEDPRTVVELYQQVARALKSIADRRDMAADDLWMRYRRIRIQDALGSSAKRAAAINELAQIDQEIERRFRKQP